MARVDRTERLLNLVFCLMASRRPVTRADISSAVPGYGVDQTDAAFERMFERDKDELRAMGVPVQTVVSVDGEVEGYRILPEEYALDAPAFTGAELAVLALAASVWDEALLAPAALHAMRKIEAAQGGSATSPVAGLRAQIGATDAALLPLMRALREAKSVTFDYQPVGAAAGRRRVDPWGLVSHERHWYLAGWDLDRAAMRVFRLSRITAPVNVTATPVSVPRDQSIDLTAVIRGEQVADLTPTLVRVAPGRAAELRRYGTVVEQAPDGDVLRIDRLGGPRLVTMLCAAGEHVRVIEPPEVRDAVTAALRRVREAHE